MKPSRLRAACFFTSSTCTWIKNPSTFALFMSIILETVWLRSGTNRFMGRRGGYWSLDPGIGSLRLFSGGTLMSLSMVIRERARIQNSFHPLSFLLCASSLLSSVYLSCTRSNLPIWIYIDLGSDWRLHMNRTLPWEQTKNSRLNCSRM